MKLGYLHIGPPEHGIRRYGQFLAAEARRRPDLTVIEADVVLTEDWRRNRAILVNAARQLSAAEVIHFQHNKLLWGNKGRLQLYYLWVFMRSCSCPLVVTFHDVYLQRRHLTGNSIIDYAQNMYGLGALALRWMLSQVQQTLVCTEEEARRLDQFVGSRKIADRSKIRVVPHFVEERTVTVSLASARRALGLEGVRTVTLLGWIFPRKGHQLVVEAILELPPDVKVIFAGRPSDTSRWFAEEILMLAKTMGVEERLRITGYLSEEELERYLVATDLAICPFKNCSASGSLSTWISVAHPTILAFDLPQINEYNRLEPGAIKTFQPYTPAALAQAIRQLLPTCGESYAPAVERLRQRLSMPAIFDEHLSHYRHVTATLHGGSSKSKHLKYWMG